MSSNFIDSVKDVSTRLGSHPRNPTRKCASVQKKIHYSVDYYMHVYTYMCVYVCVCRSVSDANLYTMTNHFTPATLADHVSVTAMRPAVSITRLWTRNPRDATSAAAASASTVRIIRPEANATHAQKDISGRQDAVCTRATCATCAIVAPTVSRAPATDPGIVTRFELATYSLTTKL